MHARVQVWQQLLASTLFFTLIFCETATSFPAFTRPSKVFQCCHHLFPASMHSRTHEPQPHVTRHTSHVTRHTSHVTRHTSRVTRHTSHVTRHTSHVTLHTSHVTRHTSHVTRHTSHVTRHTSHVTRHTSHVARHTSHVTRWLCAGMLVVEEMGGFTSGGVNFDAKTHRALRALACGADHMVACGVCSKSAGNYYS